jgi:hypothetical protein
MKTIKFNSKDNLGSVWEAEYDLLDDGTLPDNGIVLKNVRHDNYNLAKDMRVLGFWVEVEEFKNNISIGFCSHYFPFIRDYFNFDNPSMEDKGTKFRMPEKRRIKGAGQGFFSNLFNENIRGFDANIAAQSLGAFNQYGFIDGLRTVVKLKPNKVFPTNYEHSNIEITQTFLFTKYSDEPSHEPTGGLHAARIFPLITYEFIEQPYYKTSGNYFNIKSIRADYRFNNSLDTFIFVKKEGYRYDIKGTTDIKIGGQLYQFPIYSSNDEIRVKEKLFNAIDNGIKIKGVSKSDLKPYMYENEERRSGLSESYIRDILKNRPNQAGVFRDYNAEAMLLLGTLNPFTWFDYDGATGVRSIFHDLEKPLVYEIVAKGYEKSNSKLSNGKYGWDNIHWWGGKGSVHIPSAPGAFHALHLHWKWNASNYTAKAMQGDITRGFYNDQLFDGTYIKFKGRRTIHQDKEIEKNVVDSEFINVLVDPKVGIQSLEFAIVQTNKKALISSKKFKDQFIHDKESLPARIFEGEDLTLVMSLKIHDEANAYNTYEPEKGKPVKPIPTYKQSSLNGTIFIQGLFFAHEFEVINMFTGTAGIPEYGNVTHDPRKIPQIWERYGDE